MRIIHFHYAVTKLTWFAGFQASSSPFQNMKVEQSSEGDVVMTSGESPLAPKCGLDGMSALLRAGEIVGKQGGR